MKNTEEDWLKKMNKLIDKLNAQLVVENKKEALLDKID